MAVRQWLTAFWSLAHGACSVLKEVGELSPDGTKARAVKNVMKLISNSLGAAKVAPAKMAREAGSDKPALLNGQRMPMTYGPNITEPNCMLLAALLKCLDTIHKLMTSSMLQKKLGH